MSIFLALLSWKTYAQHSLDFPVPPCPYVGIIETGQPSAVIQVFPQPAAKEISIAFDRHGILGSQAIELRLYNMMGRLVTGKTIPRDATKTTLDVSALPAGIYLMQIRMDRKRYIEKIIVGRE